MGKQRHLTHAEILRLIAATEEARNSVRDRCLLLLMFRHGLRVSEACGMLVSQVDVDARKLHVHRMKSGISAVHPLGEDELVAIEAWLVERGRIKPHTDAFFVSERRGPLNRRTAWNAIRRYGEMAGLPLSVHPYMLRHACGYELAEQGVDTKLIQSYLGHQNIQHTVQYTVDRDSSTDFEGLWHEVSQ